MQSSEFFELSNVSVRFGGLAALTDVSFGIRKGTIKGVIGPNGAGKSTLFNAISGAHQPTAGAISFRGKRIERMPAHTRSGMGMARTFQNLQIFKELSVLENVMVGCHANFKAGMLGSVFRTPSQRHEEERIHATAMEKLGMLGLKRKAQSIAGDLSFGESKILEIARALAAQPDLLLLDEPVAGVPHAEVGHVMEIIRDINKSGVSVLLVEHNMRFVMQLCDDVVVLNYGKKIAEGTGEEVRNNPEVLKAYLGEDSIHA